MLISWRVMLASLFFRLLEMIPPVLIEDVCIVSAQYHIYFWDKSWINPIFCWHHSKFILKFLIDWIQKCWLSMFPMRQTRQTPLMVLPGPTESFWVSLSRCWRGRPAAGLGGPNKPCVVDRFFWSEFRCLCAVICNKKSICSYHFVSIHAHVLHVCLYGWTSWE